MRLRQDRRRRRRKKWLLHHFQPPHLPGMCQERLFLSAFLELSGHFLTPQEGPRPPKTQKPILSGNNIPKRSKRAFERIYRPARPKKCCFGKIWQHIFSRITSKVHGSRAAPLSGQNEGVIFEKTRIFRVCLRRQAHTHTDRGQTGPAAPPPTQEKVIPWTGFAPPTPTK